MLVDLVTNNFMTYSELIYKTKFVSFGSGTGEYEASSYCFNNPSLR
ncbi:MAG TPA: hypothetical protein VHJ38_15680 [Nitrososphaeraceae archaeon]|nr:hypothetical protein [Nitrososphaeraceae archaeon]